MKTTYLRTGLCWVWVAVALVIIDRLSKLWIAQHLLFEAPIKVLPVFDLTLAYNTGAAFSFLNSASGWQNIFFAVLAAIVSVVLLVALSRMSRKDWWLSVAFSLILGGAIGNAWDRLQYHYVIDFLSFHLGDWHFAIFNIADAGITIGALMLFIRWIRERG